ncbi:MAG: 4-hydroxy-3-methylbut-2-enyl diphosphate reductase [Lachnospiraceae bacterium]|nr:4-hydroxy-3-methylbut-2-enyl diphosphate reductase [Lachnospiraceae bacterium]
MEIKLSKHAGFCFGVERAVGTVYDLIKTGKTIYTYGPIVHNEEVVRELEEKGVKVIKSEEELESIIPEKDAVAVIRAHGVPVKIQELLSKKGFEVVDATCPFVKKIHKTVMNKNSDGDSIIIVGDPLHPEVIGIKGQFDGECIIFKDVSDAEKFVPEAGKSYTMVSQTTFQSKKFKEIVEILEKKEYNVHVVNTICNATEERQRAAETLAAEADAMIVIGSAGSSNTRKLYEICRNCCENTFYVQTPNDLDMSKIASADLVGITAGASTPQKLIEEVQNNVRGTYF